MKTKGTREWSDISFNIQLGCSNNCRYCYARWDDVYRFKRCTFEQWSKPVINQGKVDANYCLKDGVVMFPTRHDITNENINEYIIVLKKLLAAGNKVLIVSKPRWSCIPLICEAVKDYKSQVIFRFTIGSICDDVLNFWEPNAAGFEERLSCLEYAVYQHYQTSVSCEPFLDEFPADVYDLTIPYITESFWLGPLNNFSKRVNLDGVTDEEKQKYVEPLLTIINDREKIKTIAGYMQEKPLAKLKDTLAEIVKG